MKVTKRISPCLWFDGQAEDAVKFYTSIFERSKTLTVTRYGEAGREIHGRKPGSVMTVEFELDGQRFTALNGGPDFKFNEAISFQVHCEDQAELDRYWNKLTAGGDPKFQQCGWLKDRFGVSWQVVPVVLPKLMSDPDPERSGRVMEALLRMKKIDIEELENAFNSVVA
jgi:predicted 3-demethylubiquinone-9 3-methyltransferase (glyoxalase superfamily)